MAPKKPEPVEVFSLQSEEASVEADYLARIRYAKQADEGISLQVDEDRWRVPANPVSRCGKDGADGIFGGYSLQPGADGEPLVVTETPGRAVGDLPGTQCVSNPMTGP